MKRTLKVWTAFGAAVISTSAANAFPTADMPVVSASGVEHKAILIAGEGGEGGEGGEAAMAETAGDSEGSFLAAIGFLDGHLRAAMDVYALGDQEMAYVSVSRGAAELDENFGAAREKFGAKSFDDALAAFEAAVENSEPLETVEAKYAAVHGIMMNAVKGRSARSVFDAIITLVRTSGQEYAGGVEDGTVVDPMEFQHSYGFVKIAGDMLAAMDESERKEHADVVAKTQELLGKIDGAWPDLTGAKGAPTDPSLIAATASRIEIAALKVK